MQETNLSEPISMYLQSVKGQQLPILRFYQLTYCSLDEAHNMNECVMKFISTIKQPEELEGL